MTPKTHKRRLFFSADGETYQVMSFAQRDDGSIYVSAPEIEKWKWLSPSPAEQIIRIIDLPDAAKLSVHGSGVTHVRPKHGGDVQMRFPGNYLLKRQEEQIGLRHLLTYLPARPTHVPPSAAHARMTDCVFTSTKFEPYVLVFWAVPANRKLTVNVRWSIHVDDLEEVPPKGGFGALVLNTHMLVWCAYRTRHMDTWSNHSQACFFDGFYVPMIVATAPTEFRLELRAPNFESRDDIVTIAV